MPAQKGDEPLFKAINIIIPMRWIVGRGCGFFLDERKIVD
jgi:hypothetical protein